ncbi:MAG: ORF6N domain-containing protein [Deltaproteobacteria bacterium]|nr:ORF6N domain-containing protein [Deltaproteobacteria bacterium]
MITICCKLCSNRIRRKDGVETRSLVQAVKRNPGRFPEDFMFMLSSTEWDALKSQIGISKGRGGRRFAPSAFKVFIVKGIHACQPLVCLYFSY